MDAIFDLIGSLMGGDNSTLVVSAFVFLSAAALAFGIMAVAQVRFAVKRRASEISTGTSSAASEDPRSLRYASKVAAQRLIDYTTRHYSGEQNSGETKELRENHDCLKHFTARVTEAALLDEAELTAIDVEVMQLIEDAVAEAKADPQPDPASLYKDVYVSYN